MKRGFIQIPILIAIILGVVVLSGGSYFVSQKIKKLPQSVSNSNTPTSTSTPQTDVVSTTTDATKNGEENSIISSLQKQVSDLTKKINQPKTTKPTPPTTTVIQVEATSTPQIVVNSFPCAKFNSITDDIYGISLQLINMYLDDGTEENPSKDSFDYPYNKTNTQKTTFYANITKLNQKIDLLDAYDGTTQAKSELSQTASLLQEAFDLKLQGFKLVNNDAFVYVSGYKIMPPDNIDQARLNVNQAYSKYLSAIDFLTKGKAVLSNIEKTNNCN